MPELIIKWSAAVMVATVAIVVVLGLVGLLIRGAIDLIAAAVERWHK